MAGKSPVVRLPAFFEELRDHFMDQNGIHIMYPLGRDYPISYPAYFPAYQDFMVRWFGYIVDISSLMEIGMFAGNGHVLMKFEKDSRITAVVQDNKGNIAYPRGGTSYSNGDYFSFAARTRYNGGLDKDTIEDAIIAGVVYMFPGSYAVYSGIYTGPEVIRINAPGAVSDLGKPDISGIYVKIGVRKNLKMFVFYADYGNRPVLAPFGELMNTGHDYIPRFSLNFNVRHVVVLLEVEEFLE
ncbi:hypothetical protein MRX96_026726 [Rhipicephalus microplus]